MLVESWLVVIKFILTKMKEISFVRRNEKYDIWRRLRDKHLDVIMTFGPDVIKCTNIKWN